MVELITTPESFLEEINAKAKAAEETPPTEVEETPIVEEPTTEEVVAEETPPETEEETTTEETKKGEFWEQEDEIKTEEATATAEADFNIADTLKELGIDTVEAGQLKAKVEELKSLLEKGKTESDPFVAKVKEMVSSGMTAEDIGRILNKTDYSNADPRWLKEQSLIMKNVPEAKREMIMDEFDLLSEAAQYESTLSVQAELQARDEAAYNQLLEGSRIKKAQDAEIAKNYQEAQRQQAEAHKKIIEDARTGITEYVAAKEGTDFKGIKLDKAMLQKAADWVNNQSPTISTVKGKPQIDVNAMMETALAVTNFNKIIAAAVTKAKFDAKKEVADVQHKPSSTSTPTRPISGKSELTPREQALKDAEEADRAREKQK